MDKNETFDRWWETDVQVPIKDAPKAWAKCGWKACEAHNQQRIQELEYENAMLKVKVGDVEQKYQERLNDYEDDYNQLNNDYILVRDSRNELIKEKVNNQQANEIVELQAHIEDLREALEVAFSNIELFKTKWMHVPPFGNKVNKTTRQAVSEATSPIFIAYNFIQNALASTPQQSLQNLIDGVREDDAKIVEALIIDSMMKPVSFADIADAIRALKGKPL